ncbi:hypothetical protein RRG08_040696 [Elysia crispata]|uniref:Uncharacterized protein n=1 Tax=Elysia crispata TaxID=231223 RepID=A0AAE1E6C6_9GAST|nr:hypothetical protein RRG08_040696 [Elysia crispata]
MRFVSTADRVLTVIISLDWCPSIHHKTAQNSWKYIDDFILHRVTFPPCSDDLKTRAKSYYGPGLEFKRRKNL